MSKLSFIFYTVITGWDNLKDLHKLFFQKFTILLSESLVSKAYYEEFEMVLEKIRHGFCQENGQLQKPLPYFTQLSPLEICMRNVVVIVSIFIV